MAGRRDGVCFVDDAESFRRVVREEGYDALFVDCFAGDFGHCTCRGDRLPAENIARVIVRDVLRDPAGRLPDPAEK